MSISKVLGGTVIATPAVGGGGYVIYKEVTKEAAETNLPTEPTTQPVTENEKTVQPKAAGSDGSQNGGSRETQQEQTPASPPVPSTGTVNTIQPGGSS